MKEIRLKGFNADGEEVEEVLEIPENGEVLSKVIWTALSNKEIAKLYGGVEDVRNNKI